MVQLTHLKDGMPSRGTQAGSKVGPWEPQAVQVQGAAHGSGQPPVTIQAEGQIDQEQPCQKGAGSAGE